MRARHAPAHRATARGSWFVLVTLCGSKQFFTARRQAAGLLLKRFQAQEPPGRRRPGLAYAIGTVRSVYGF